MTQASAFMAQYHRAVANGQLHADPGQLKAAEALDVLYRSLTIPTPRKRWQWLVNSPRPRDEGLYLWGEVGRGKSMLMDMFVTAIQGQKKNAPRAFSRFHA